MVDVWWCVSGLVCGMGMYARGLSQICVWAMRLVVFSGRGMFCVWLCLDVRVLCWASPLGLCGSASLGVLGVRAVCGLWFGLCATCCVCVRVGALRCGWDVCIWDEVLLGGCLGCTWNL